MRWRLVAVAVISMAVFGAQTAHAAAIQEQPNYLGLVGYWPFDEGAGTVADDFSGNGNAVTLATDGSALPAWVPGKFGHALSFDGSSNYVTVPNVGGYLPSALQLTHTGTVSLWVNPAAGDDGSLYRAVIAGAGNINQGEDSVRI